MANGNVISFEIEVLGKSETIQQISALETSVRKVAAEKRALDKVVRNAEKIVASYDSNLAKLNKQFEETEKKAKLYSDAQKTLDKRLKSGKISQESYNKAVKELKAKISANTKAKSQYTQAVEKLNKEQQAAKKIIKSEAEQRAKLTAKEKALRAEKRRLNKELRHQRKQLEANEGSMAAFRLETTKLTKQVNNFAVGIDGTEKDLKKLKRQLANNRKAIIDWDQSLNDGRTNVGRYGASIREVIVGNSSLLGSFSSLGGMLAGGMGIAALGSMFVEVSSEAIRAVNEIVTEFTALRNEIATLSGATGEELDKYVVKSATLAAVYKKDTEEINVAANNMAQAFGISFGEALDYIEQGFDRGANIGGEFLSKMEEYPAQFAAAELSAQDFIDAATSEVLLGFYKDKGVDAVKEFAISVNEGTKTTKEAFERAYGVDYTKDFFKRINNGTTSAGAALEEFVGKIRESNLPISEQQTLIADVFRGAGEDAQILQENGLLFLETVVDMRNGVSTLTDEQQAYLDTTQKVKEATTRLNEAKNDLTKLIGNEASGFQVLQTNIQAYLIESLNKLITTFQPVMDTFDELFSTLGELGELLFGVKEEGDATGESIDVMQMIFDALAGQVEFVVSVFNEAIQAFIWAYNEIPLVGQAVDFVKNIFINLYKVLSNLPSIFKGIIAAARQMVTNIRSWFERMVIDLQIAKKKIEKVNPFGKTSAQLDDEIEALKKRKKALLDAGKSVGESFSEGFNNSVQLKQDRKAEAALQNEVAAKLAAEKKAAEELKKNQKLDGCNKTSKELEKEEKEAEREDKRVEKELERQRKQEERKAEQALKAEQKLKEELLKLQNEAIVSEINLIEDGLERETKLKIEQSKQEIATLEAKKIKKANLSEDEIAFNAAINKQIKLKKKELNQDLEAIDERYRKEIDAKDEQSLKHKIDKLEEESDAQRQILGATITDAADLEEAKRQLAIETTRKKLDLLKAEALASGEVTEAQLEQIRTLAAELEGLTSEDSDKFSIQNVIQSAFGVDEEMADTITSSAASVANDLYSFLKDRKDEQIQNDLNKELQAAEKTNKIVLEKLEEQKAAGLISEQVYEQRKEGIQNAYENRKLAAEERAFEQNKKAQRNRALIDAAVAAVKLWASPGFPLAIPMSIALGAKTALQIAAINRQEFPKAEKGLSLLNKGRRHSEGGEIVEIQRDEVVVNADSVKSKKVVSATGTPLQILDAINTMDGNGIDFIRSGKISFVDAMRPFDGKGSAYLAENGLSLSMREPTYTAGLGGIVPNYRASVGIGAIGGKGVSPEQLMVLMDAVVEKVNNQKLVTPVREISDKQKELENTNTSSIWNQ